MIELSKKQSDFLPAVRWLLDLRHHIGEGRTRLMAYAFVQLATEYPNEVILTFDHCPTQRCTRDILMREVRAIVNKRPGFELGSNWIQFVPKAKEVASDRQKV